MSTSASRMNSVTTACRSPFPRKVLGFLIVCALALPASSLARQGSVAANVCALAAPAAAVIKKDIGTPSAAPQFVPNAGAYPNPYCDVPGKGVDVRIYLKPAGKAASEIAGIEGEYSSAQQKHVVKKSLTGAGAGATLYYYPGGDVFVWFTKTSHFVTLVGYGTTPRQTVLFARAVYGKLH